MTIGADDLAVGATYRAKRPRRYGDGFNDRTIIYISRGGDIQYDGVAVRIGQHYPRVTRDQFLAWAGSRVTEC